MPIVLAPEWCVQKPRLELVIVRQRVERGGCPEGAQQLCEASVDLQRMHEPGERAMLVETNSSTASLLFVECLRAVYQPSTRPHSMQRYRGDQMKLAIGRRRPASACVVEESGSSQGEEVSPAYHP